MNISRRTKILSAPFPAAWEGMRQSLKEMAARIISFPGALNRLIAENEAMDTVENIEFSYDIIKRLEQSEHLVRIGIVTNNFHLFRGLHIARKLTEAEVCGISAYTEHLYLPNNMVRESFGILRDCVL